MAFCNYTHRSFGGCQQDAAIEHWCEFHYRFLVVLKQEPADDYYHRKVLSRKLTPTWPDMTPAESWALRRGRVRQDGRRLDLWVIADDDVELPSD